MQMMYGQSAIWLCGCAALAAGACAGAVVAQDGPASAGG